MWCVVCVDVLKLKTFRTEFIIEIEYERRSLIHLRRSFAQLKELESSASQEDTHVSWLTFRTVSDECMPVTKDGQSELVEDADVSIVLRDVVSECCAPWYHGNPQCDGDRLRSG